MGKVFVVLNTYERNIGYYQMESYKDGVCEIFDSEEKAVGYIREQFKEEHESVKLAFPANYEIVKYPVPKELSPNTSVTSFEAHPSNDDHDISYSRYKYVVYEVK